MDLSILRENKVTSVKVPDTVIGTGYALNHSYYLKLR